MNTIERQLYYANYIIKVLREEDYYYNAEKVRLFVYRNILTEDDFLKSKYLLKASKNWSSFRELMEKEFNDEF
jgi:hypothetical protein